MDDDLILSFPVIKNNGGDFMESVSYIAEATQENNRRILHITHTLKGDSFIAKLIRDKKAKFSVTFFYKDSKQRQKFIYDEFDYDAETQEITAEQKIDIDFSYAPEITANIVIFEDVKITVDDKSGLVGFWDNEYFNIPAFSRIAHYLTLKFTSGDVSSLLSVDCDEFFVNGSIKTIVSETIGEDEQPIKIRCAQDVFDELKKDVVENPTDAKTAFRASIVTQVLCHVYAHMSNLDDKENDIHSGLLAHMESVKEVTGEDWEGDDFNPSFAATKMIPYAIEALNKEDN